MDLLQRMRSRNTVIGRWDRGFSRMCLLVAATSAAVLINNYVDAAPLPAVTVGAAFDISRHHGFSNLPLLARAADYILGMEMPVFCLIGATLLSLLAFIPRRIRIVNAAEVGDTAPQLTVQAPKLEPGAESRPSQLGPCEAMTDFARDSDSPGDRWHRAILAGEPESAVESGD